MLVQYKTKAALQGRQCHYQIHSQDNTAGDPGKYPCGITAIFKGGIPSLEQNHVVMHLPPYLEFGSCKGCSDVSNGQPFGLASRSKRWRQASLTHALNWPGPAASSICSKSSSSKRIFFFVLPDRSKAGLVFLSCIGTYRYCRLKINGTYQFVFVQPLNTAKPGSALTLTGPLTKPLNEVTVMADQQHTQTHPKFTWHFLALPRADVAAAPCHLSISAVSEKEARRVLAPYFILSLSGRLPAQGVSHA